MGWAEASPSMTQHNVWGGGKSQAGGFCYWSTLKKEPSGFPAKNNRNKIILHAPRERFRRRVKGRPKLWGCCLVLHGAWDLDGARILPSLVLPQNHQLLCPQVLRKAAQGTHPRACESAQPVAPAEHAQLDLRCLIPVKRSGCPVTHGSRGKSWPVVLPQLPSHPLDGQGSEDSGFSAGDPLSAAWGNPWRGS